MLWQGNGVCARRKYKVKREREREYIRNQREGGEARAIKSVSREIKKTKARYLLVRDSIGEMVVQ